MEFNEKKNIPKQKLNETIKIIKKTEKIENTKNILLKNKNRKLLYLLLGLSLLFLLLFTIKISSFLSQSKLSKIIRTKRILDNQNYYNSFASKTSSNYIKYLIDSKEYFEDLLETLMEAKESIYISGFKTDPEIFLKRPVNVQIYIDMFKKKILTKDFGENMTRLIDILDYKAKKNVKIYILVHYEWAHGLVTSSKHLEDTIKKLNNKNIHFIRFPNNADVKFWTTHEKFIIVDKIIGFIGGIDLSWGKYDSPEHLLYEGPKENNIYEFPLMDYRNQQIYFYYDVENYTKTEISREHQNRFPWHDIQMKIVGPSVKDLVKHFFERWNHAINCEEKLKNTTFGIDQVKQLVDKINRKSIWKTFNNLIFDSQKIENDYFVENDMNVNEKIEKEIYSKYKKKGNFNSDALVLRSVSKWSIGVNETEQSILNAYYDLIQNAKHYIYIENQYFISKSWTNKEKKEANVQSKDVVKNQVSYYIRKRIEKAYKNNENFKVFIMIPIFPSQGINFEDNFSILKVEPLIKYTYQTINRNNGLSMIEQLEKKMGDKWKNYISFYSLRTHGLVNNVPTTERIHVHSKLLIVDDTKVIIGSPNLNDRALLGDRDSEIAILIEEKKENNFIMNGNKYQASKTAVELRKKLMAEYLGIDMNDPILDDPVNNDLLNYMNSKARNNTEIYRKIFNCFPDDLYTSYKIYNEAQKQKDEWPDVLLNKYIREKNKIQGFIVKYSFDFLKNEKMNKNFILPEFAYT
jgi:phospholipase D1/2